MDIFYPYSGPDWLIQMNIQIENNIYIFIYNSNLMSVFDNSNIWLIINSLENVIVKCSVQEIEYNSRRK